MRKNHFWMLAAVVIAAVMLGGCAQQLERAETLGAAALQAKEDASALVVKGCRRYVCRSGRIGAIYDEFSSDGDRAGWAAICKVREQTPELP